MSEREINTLVLQRFGASGQPLRRCRIRNRVRRQRLRWNWELRRDPWVKRLFDIVFSSAVICVFAPLFLLIAVLIKIEDRGPIFFTQIRVGKYGRLFKMYKFRSMCIDAEKRLEELKAKNKHKEGVTFKIKDDPRITRVGKWLRKLSMDEMPQFFNVLFGDMSVVGPRPPVPREVALYTPAHRRRLAVKPGITCIWQVSGRAEIDFSGQVALDVRYIECQSLLTDLKIAVQTIPAVLSGRGAC
jgi:exopolysaccharide biosynthesis polyprenyl glycosylphosphotransferase